MQSTVFGDVMVITPVKSGGSGQRKAGAALILPGNTSLNCTIKRTRKYRQVRSLLFLVHPQKPQSDGFFGLTPGPQAVFRLVVATTPDGMFRFRPNMRSASNKMFQLAFWSRSPT